MFNNPTANIIFHIVKSHIVIEEKLDFSKFLELIHQARDDSDILLLLFVLFFILKKLPLKIQSNIIIIVYIFTYQQRRYHKLK